MLAGMGLFNVSYWRLVGNRDIHIYLYIYTYMYVCIYIYSRYRKHRKHMAGSQNYGPFLGPYYNTAPNI